jgi:2-polyprenyl-3-methyl-5-hydroxy-6-metoxy-1,4-benzoquinol methylase
MIESLERPLDLEQAWSTVLSTFPFQGYIRLRRKGAYLRLVREAHRVLKEGRILDFGAGPADKTALFSLTGFEVVAFDDFEDPWHKVDDNRAKILRFAERAGVEYRHQGSFTELFSSGERFDMIMLHHVLEHLHDSPKDLMLLLLEMLKPGGYLFVSVPNAGNIRKRLALALGGTNLPNYSSYYWYPGPFRGHVREYVKGDLEQLAQFLNLRVVRLASYFHFPQRLPAVPLWLLDRLSFVAPGWRDSWLMVAQKPEKNWSPERARSGNDLAESLGKSEYYDYSTFPRSLSGTPEP